MEADSVSRMFPLVQLQKHSGLKEHTPYYEWLRQELRVLVDIRPEVTRGKEGETRRATS